jgi:hypothetical protein
MHMTCRMSTAPFDIRIRYHVSLRTRWEVEVEVSFDFHEAGQPIVR